MVSGVGVASVVAQPDVVACIGENVTCNEKHLMDTVFLSIGPYLPRPIA